MLKQKRRVGTWRALAGLTFFFSPGRSSRYPGFMPYWFFRKLQHQASQTPGRVCSTWTKV